MSSSNSGSTIMTIADMIDSAFGEPDVNTVNHKLIQTILYLLARQLRVLERRVEIEIGTALQPSSSSLSVTEVKVHAMQKKKKRLIKGTAGGAGRDTGGGRGGAVGGTGSGHGPGRGGGQSGPQGQLGQTTTGVLAGKSLPASLSDKISSGKTSSHKTSSHKTSDKTSSDKTASDLTVSDKTSSQKTSSGKTSSDKTSSDKTTTGKTSSDKTSTDKTSSDKTSSIITSSDKTSTDKTSSYKTSSDKTSTDKTSSDKTSSDKTSSDKTSTDKTSSYKTSSEKTSTDKTSTDKTSTAKTSSDKTSSDNTTSDKNSSDKTSSNKTATDKTSSDKTSSEKPSSSEKTSSDPTSSAKTSSNDKTSTSDKRSTTTTDKSTSEKTSTGKTSSSRKTTTTDTSSSLGRDPGDYAKLLEAIEEQREEELRIIHQRADSREEHEKTPSPMASLDSVEAKYEKLLVVERITADEAKALTARGRSGSRDKAPRISVVTQEQFEELASSVRQLQEKFGPVGSASFPENIQLMHELRKGASLTDAMAALQLSARLEASEKALEQMLSLVTDLASKTPGFDMAAVGAGEDMEVLFGRGATGLGGGGAGASGGGAGAGGTKGQVSVASRKSIIVHKTGVQPKKELSPQDSSSEKSMIIPLPQSVVLQEKVPSTATGGTEEAEKEPPDSITYEDMDNAMQDLYDEIIKTVTHLTMKSSVNADNAFKTASKLEGKLDASLNLGTRMQDLEALVTKYSEQINILDTSFSSQMTNYQEELTQMQHDLETALETMAEVLANAGGDTTAVAELNNHFSDLQSDIDDTMMRQKELKNTQNALAVDLESLRKQIEILREAKSDRDEVADALRDKAGLGALNGLVPLQQFDAVRGDMEKRIGNAYDKFNSQEIIWQKAIDDLLRELNEKADWIQVVSLKEDINMHLEKLRCRLNAMMEIVGEPKAAAVAKKLHRDATCLSCATPADMELEEHGIVPALPAMRPPAIGAEATQPKEDGDHPPCYPGLPLPHPRDPRSHVCQRWCGGSHTVVSNTVPRVPPGMIITPAVRKVSTALGTDGKMYMVDQPLDPCRQCIRNTTPQQSIADQIHEQEEDVGSGMTPFDFQPSLACVMPQESETPPPPRDDDE